MQKLFAVSAVVVLSLLIVAAGRKLNPTNHPDPTSGAVCEFLGYEATDKLGFVGTGAAGSPICVATNGDVTLSGSFKVDNAAGTDAMCLDSSGELGVGTCSPAAVVHAASASGTTAGFIAENTAATGGGRYEILHGAGGALAIQFSGATEMRIFQGDRIQIETILRLEDVLKFTPTDAPPTCDSGNEGAMYGDDSLNLPCYCNGTGWVQMDDFSTGC